VTSSAIESNTVATVSTSENAKETSPVQSVPNSVEASPASSTLVESVTSTVTPVTVTNAPVVETIEQRPVEPVVVQRPVAAPVQRAAAAPRPVQVEARPSPPPVVVPPPQPSQTVADVTTEVIRKAAVTSSAASETLAPVIANIPPPPSSSAPAPAGPSTDSVETRSSQPIVNQGASGSVVNSQSNSAPVAPVGNSSGGSAVVQDSSAAPAAIPAGPVGSSSDPVSRPDSPVGFSPTPYATPNANAANSSTGGGSSSSLPIPIIAAAAGGCLLVLVGGFVLYRNTSKEGESISAKFFKQPEDQRDPEAALPQMEDNKRTSDNIFRETTQMQPAPFLPPLVPLGDESYGNLTPSMISSVVTTDSMYFESAPLPPTPPMLPPLGHFDRLEADRNRFSSILSEDVMSLRSPSPSVSNTLQRPDLVTAALRMATTDSNRSSVSSVSSLESSVYSDDRESTYTMGIFEFSESSLV
jgi:hypothetical protein